MPFFSTREVVSHLVDEGFVLNESRLRSLIRRGVIKPPAMNSSLNWLWREADVEQVRRALVDRGLHKEQVGAQ